MVLATIFDGMFKSDYVWAAFWILIAFILAEVISEVMKRFAKEAKKRARITLDEKIVPAIRRPIMYLIVVAGFYLAVMNVSVLIPYWPVIMPVIGIIGIAFGALLVLRLGNVLLVWYTESRAPKSEATYTEMMPTVQKVWMFLIVVIALVMVLGQAGIEVGPLVTSLGIAGLAVALAFQDTLANFFAGLYLTTNRPIKKGQFIKLDTGQDGYVENVDWRNTKLKSSGGQVVIIPNVKMSQAIITNYHEPIKKYSFSIPFLVRPDTDLEKVEAIVKDAANKAIKTTPGADTGYQPLFRVSEVNEYGVKAAVIVQTNEYSDQFLLKHEILSGMLKRFRKEGIELPFLPDAMRKR